jgi:hypothetical protein
MGIFARLHGACCAKAHESRQNTTNQWIVFILLLLARAAAGRRDSLSRAGLVLFQPKSHQLNFRLLVRDDLLRQPAHLRILPIHQLGPGHVDSSLVVRKHQSDKINVAIARVLYRRHGNMHFLHAPQQLRPVRIHARLTIVRVRFLLPGGQCSGGYQNQENC